MKKKYKENEAEVKAANMCSLWEHYIKDSTWHPLVKRESTCKQINFIPSQFTLRRERPETKRPGSQGLHVIQDLVGESIGLRKGPSSALDDTNNHGDAGGTNDRLRCLDCQAQ
ncbi:XH/XS domain protein [Medicago truncatula]|uniref:XH/XS domain protein n=1 Tax=Medicago truncatula TaxID=3880 RepID=G7JRG6_MEDTR|nr:XH/XS domain protein [Medicago truncatula]